MPFSETFHRLIQRYNYKRYNYKSNFRIQGSYRVIAFGGHKSKPFKIKEVRKCQTDYFRA